MNKIVNFVQIILSNLIIKMKIDSDFKDQLIEDRDEDFDPNKVQSLSAEKVIIMTQ
jgi:hypothetical protein